MLIRLGSRVLEMILLTRHDNGKLAVPGGFVLPGESAVEAARRKLAQEAFAIESVRT